jgi:hypothetical protein
MAAPRLLSYGSNRGSDAGGMTAVPALKKKGQLAPPPVVLFLDQADLSPASTLSGVNGGCI